MYLIVLLRYLILGCSLFYLYTCKSILFIDVPIIVVERYSINSIS